MLLWNKISDSSIVCNRLSNVTQAVLSKRLLNHFGIVPLDSLVIQNSPDGLNSVLFLCLRMD